MSFRIEKKIFIKKEQLSEFKKFLFENNIKKLHNSRVVESVYFENRFHQIFFDSVEGLCPRKKIRVRSYPESSDQQYYLEFKVSSIEGRYKINKKITKKKCDEMFKNGIFDKQYGHCKPKIYVKYLREYYMMKNTRITYDKDIEYLNVQQRILGKENSKVLELKPNKDKSVDELFLDFPFSRIRYSKYCFGINKFQYRNGKK